MARGLSRSVIYPAQARMGELRARRRVLSVSVRVWEGLCERVSFLMVRQSSFFLGAVGTQRTVTVTDEAISYFRGTRCGAQGFWKRQKKELRWCVTGLNDLARFLQAGVVG